MAKRVDGNVHYNNPHIKPNVYLKGNKGLKEKREFAHYDKGYSSTSIFTLVMLILFIYAYVYYVRTGTISTISFKSLLEYFTTVPDITSSFYLSNFSIGGDWGIFDFLRSFLNIFANFFSVSFSVFGFLIQGLVFIFWCVRFFFV